MKQLVEYNKTWPDSAQLQAWAEVSATVSTNTWNCSHPEPWNYKPTASVLLYVVTHFAAVERQGMLRSMYRPFLQTDFDLLFVVGHSADVEAQQRVCLQQRLHGDLIMLNCTENLQGGKTYYAPKAILELIAQGMLPQYAYLINTEVSRPSSEPE